MDIIISAIIVLKYRISNTSVYSIRYCELSRHKSLLVWGCNMDKSRKYCEDMRHTEPREPYRLAKEIARKNNLFFVGYRNTLTDTVSMTHKLTHRSIGGYPCYSFNKSHEVN